VIAELLVAAALAAGPAPTVLDGVPVHPRPGTEQVVTVNHTEGHHARVTFWRLTDAGWVARFTADDGRIGYGGLVRGTKRRQGTGTTPLGTYALPWAFGTGPRDDRWRLSYRQVRAGDFWVQDNQSDHYNRYRNQAAGGFRWWLPASDPDSSERLSDFGRQYRISIVTDFNRSQVRHRGAGIFLHVNGAGATAGCVSAPGRFLDKLMRVLDPERVPVIAVGR
jgi:L,D-peptidoglycan transpeptidase YkuD (ErfK/YbiS/YcfS/YnhG family)